MTKSEKLVLSIMVIIGTITLITVLSRLYSGDEISDVKPKKELEQYFITNETKIALMLNAANINRNDVVMEVS